MRVIRIKTEQGQFEPVEIGEFYNDLAREVKGIPVAEHLPELDERNLVLLVNYKGINEGLPCNTNLFPFFYVGNVLMCNRRNTDGELVSLTDEQVKFGMKWLTGLPL